MPKSSVRGEDLHEVSVMIERRKALRKIEGNKVTTQLMIDSETPLGQKISFALTDDISLSGIKILSDIFFPIDSLLKIDLSLAKTNRIIDLTGRVRWIKSLGGEIYEIGIEVVDTSKDNILNLMEHLYNIKRDV